MKYIIVLASFLLLSSCNEDIIYYEYNGYIITCVMKGDKLFFYNGKHEGSDVGKLNSYIQAEKNKIDHSIEGYIHFGNDGKVEILPVFGDFNQVGENDSLTILSYSIIDTTCEASPQTAKLYGKHYRYMWTDSLVREGLLLKNVIYFSDKRNTIGLGPYKEVNKKTKVKVIRY